MPLPVHWQYLVLATAGCLAHAAAPEKGLDRVRLFLDPQRTWVDQTYLQTEIGWVDWVRDRQEASVHLLVSQQPNGGGGTRYTLRFLGLAAFQGLDDELYVDTTADATEDAQRQALSTQIALGLARYAARLPRPERLSLTARKEATATTPAKTADKDPWNAWVYRLGINSYISGESQTSSSSTYANASARRITEDEIIRFNTSGNWNDSRYDLSDEVYRSHSESYSGYAVYAKAINDRWTWGVLGSGSKSKMGNVQHRERVAPAIEYNIWKYSESNQKQLTFLYQVGYSRANYIQETVYGKMSESLADHTLTVSLDLNQPWGTVSMSLNGSAYLHDSSKRSISFYSSLSVKLAKGLSLNLYGSYSQIRNQLALPKGGATDDEILLRLKELQTDYRFSTSIGLSYTFGSIFNDAVNSRFKNY